MRSLGGRESGQNVLQIVKGIYLEALAGLDDAHDCGSSLSAFFGAGKEPVLSAKNHRLDAALTGVVAYVHEGMLEVNQESGPSIESVRDGFSKLSLRRFEVFDFIEPSFELLNFWFCTPLSQLHSVGIRKRFGNLLDVEKTFDHSH